jgi:hypothetical protein
MMHRSGAAGAVFSTGGQSTRDPTTRRMIEGILAMEDDMASRSPNCWLPSRKNWRETGDLRNRVERARYERVKMHPPKSRFVSAP